MQNRERVVSSLTPDERHEVESAARLVGMNLAQYLRWAAIKAARE